MPVCGPGSGRNRRRAPVLYAPQAPGNSHCAPTPSGRSTVSGGRSQVFRLRVRYNLVVLANPSLQRTRLRSPLNSISLGATTPLAHGGLPMHFDHSAPWSLVNATPRLLSAALIAFWPCAASATPDTVTLERNKALATRVFTEIFNERRFAAPAELYAPEFVNHGLHRNFSLQEDQAAAQGEVKAFPD